MRHVQHQKHAPRSKTYGLISFFKGVLILCKVNLDTVIKDFVRMLLLTCCQSWRVFWLTLLCFLWGPDVCLRYFCTVLYIHHFAYHVRFLWRYVMPDKSKYYNERIGRAIQPWRSFFAHFTLKASRSSEQHIWKKNPLQVKSALNFYVQVYFDLYD